MRPAGEDRTAAHGGRSSARRRTRRERRVLRIGLALSALFHLALVGILGGLLESPPAAPAVRSTPVAAEPPPGMRAVAIRSVTEVQPATRNEPMPEPVPARESRPPASSDAEEDVLPPPVAAGPDDLTAADRLAPRLVDPRLWRPRVLIPREPTLADVQARIDAAVELLSDSALADAERQIRALDWTVADDDGGRWGISPGKLHLGRLTLPLPISYVPEYDPARDEYYDLEAQVDRTRFLESFEDRVRKIRERRDRERREAQGGEGGSVAGSGGGGP